MPRVTRRRSIAAPPSEIWALVSDPYNLPRWWPRTTRIENVEIEGGAPRTWTTVLETSEGRGVRADYRCTDCAPQRRYAWEQQLDGTPFQRHLRAMRAELVLEPKGNATDVSISVTQALRGMSRLGSPAMRRGQGAILDEALDGIERALVGGDG